MLVQFLGSLSPWLSIPLAFLTWILVLSLIKRIVFSVAKKFAEKTKTRLDDVLFDALELPVQLLIYASGALVIESILPKAGDPQESKLLFDGVKVIAILSAILFADKFVRGLITLYAEKIDILRTAGGFARGIVRAVIMGLGALIILDSFGISITPIIASLGIGSLAVALALQPTLENFFSGIQLVADKPIQVGQFIQLDSGEMGTVVKVGWRSTWVCMSNNNTVILPNKLLVNSRVTNYHYPDQEMAVLVGVGVHYQSDLDKVERVTADVAREIMRNVPGGVPSFDPFIRYHTFADFSINFNVILRAKDWPSSHVVKHEFIKLLQKRYAQQGILIPFPTRTVVQG